MSATPEYIVSAAYLPTYRLRNTSVGKWSEYPPRYEPAEYERLGYPCRFPSVSLRKSKLSTLASKNFHWLSESVFTRLPERIIWSKRFYELLYARVPTPLSSLLQKGLKKP